jgi:tRNA 2-(methylsulfanyl)-N6-isopentenyladenosine37 hydroxylase
MLCLTVSSDDAWVAEATRDLDAVLVDHAHCEMKAASNARSLAARYPHDGELVSALLDIAREEADHHRRVVSILSARGLELGPPAVDAYAAALRRAPGELPRSRDISVLADRLLVGALIEARSCERFKLLADSVYCDPGREDCHALWAGLFASEARHYSTFVELAVRVASDRAAVHHRLGALAEAEGRIVRGLARGSQSCSRATIHG